jgi:hypothetical protein
VKLLAQVDRELRPLGRRLPGFGAERHHFHSKPIKVNRKGPERRCRRRQSAPPEQCRQPTRNVRFVEIAVSSCVWGRKRNDAAPNRG